MNKIYTVSEVNSYIKKLFNDDYLLCNIGIKGEISNLKYHISGHIYFTLKDDKSAISCIIFAKVASRLDFKMENGMNVHLNGQISVYEKTGSYQIYVQNVIRSGIGKLYIEFEKLKNELYERGMFDVGYKKEIPKFAQKIGIVTSDTGAAIRDIIRVSKQRNPYVELFLCPSKVQGENAALEIANAIKTLDTMYLDVLIVGRGGGSIEDLWAFNERIVADAIFSCDTPVISAVGHETDFTIADFVADLREATPSSAAAKAVFDYRAFLENMIMCKIHLYNNMLHKLSDFLIRLDTIKKGFERFSPKNRLNEQRLNIDRLFDIMTDLLTKRIDFMYRKLNLLFDRFYMLIKQRLIFYHNKIDIKFNAFRLLSPKEKLKNGYSLISDKNGRAIKSIKDVNKNDIIQIYVNDGCIISEVVDKHEDRL